MTELVAHWSKIVASIPNYTHSFDEYLDDMDFRQLLEDIRQTHPNAIDHADIERLKKADAVFHKATQGASQCIWGHSNAAQSGWDSSKNPWYFRLPNPNPFASL